MNARLRSSEAEIASLQRSEHRLRSTLDAMLEGCQILDRDLRYLYLNPAAEAQSRRPPGSLVEQLFVDAWPGVEATELHARMLRCLETRVADRFENEFEFPDGSRGWFELRLEPVPEGILILSADVTERRRSEARARWLHETLSATSRINQLIVRAKDAAALMQGACDALVGSHSVASAWVATVDGSGRPGVFAQAGLDGRFLEFRERFESGWRPPCWSLPRGRADVTEFVRVDPATTCRTCPLGESGPPGIVGVVALDHEGHDFGSLGVCRAPGGDASDEEVAMLSEVAGDLALALFALRGEQDRAAFAQMVASSQDAIALVDRDYRFLHVNPAYARLWGREPDELLGRPALEIVGAELFERGAKPRIDAAFAGQNVEALVTHELPSGDVRTAEVRYEPSRDRGGHVTAVAITLHDVTERVRAEARLLESEQRLSAIFHRSPVGVVLTRESDGLIVDANRSFGELYGAGPEELIGKTSLELGLWAEPAQRREMLRRLKAQGACRDLEILARRRDAALRTVRISVERVELAAEYYTLGVIEDVTERKEAEARRVQLEAQLRAAQKMEAIGTLAGGVAHDFNNLLVVILNCADFALDRAGEDEDMRGDLEQIKDAGERAAGLTRQLLAFGRKQVLQPEPLSVNAAVEGFAKMLRRILGEDIELVLELAPGAGVVMADPGQLEQVLMNLVTNARDAMPEGGRLIIATADLELDTARAGGLVDVAPGRYVELRVTDTGCGMDESVRARVFEPFFTTKEKGRGTGLGLATAYGIVKQSGGYIWIDSAPGRGTSVRIDLPRIGAVAGPREPAPASAPARGHGAVLVVEDEEGVRDLVRRTLGATGYQVVTAADRDEALAACAARATPFDLLLTDVVMPRVGGRKVAEELTARWPGLRVLFMSGYTDDAIARHGVLAPGTRFLAKPFTIAGLLTSVREVLDAPAPGAPR